LYHYYHVPYDLARTKGLPGLSQFRRYLDPRDGLALLDSSFFTTFEDLLIVTLVYIFIRRPMTLTCFFYYGHMPLVWVMLDLDQ